MTDREKFEEMARQSDRLTASELALWHQIQQNVESPKSGV